MITSAGRIRVLAVDDHPIVREGIAALIAIQPDMILVGEASDGREAIQQFRTHRPDVTVMDLQMPEMNGLDALSAIRNEFPDAKVIMLTTYKSDTQIVRALKAGAQGYLLKSALHKELLQTIRAANAGKKTISPEASLEIVEHATDDALTPAEISVLRLIATGRANKEIADQLSTTEEFRRSTYLPRRLKRGSIRPLCGALFRWEKDENEVFGRGASIATLVFYFRWRLARNWSHLNAARCRVCFGEQCRFRTAQQSGHPHDNLVCSAGCRSDSSPHRAIYPDRGIRGGSD